jgi:hypothetical protein
METTTPSVQKQFLFLYAIALSDFEMHPLEIEFLTEFGKSKGVSEVEIEHMLLNPVNFDDALPDTIEDRIESLYHLAQMIWADGKIAEEELKLLKRFCKTFGFKDENIQAIADFLIERARLKVPVSEVVREVSHIK